MPRLTKLFRQGALHRSALLLCGLVVVLAACEKSENGENEEHEDAKKSDIEFLTPFGPPVNPFSPAVRVDNMLYLAGQIGTDSTGKLVPGGIDAETRQTLQNIAQVLSLTGSSMERVVKCTAFLADMQEWPAMNEVYKTFFPVNKPARSAFGATALALGARVEIECLAVVGK